MIRRATCRAKRQGQDNEAESERRMAAHKNLSQERCCLKIDSLLDAVKFPKVIFRHGLALQTSAAANTPGLLMPGGTFACESARSSRLSPVFPWLEGGSG